MFVVCWLNWVSTLTPIVYMNVLPENLPSKTSWPDLSSASAGGHSLRPACASLHIILTSFKSFPIKFCQFSWGLPGVLKVINCETESLLGCSLTSLFSTNTRDLYQRWIKLKNSHSNGPCLTKIPNMPNCCWCRDFVVAIICDATCRLQMFSHLLFVHWYYVMYLAYFVAL